MASCNLLPSRWTSYCVSRYQKKDACGAVGKDKLVCMSQARQHEKVVFLPAFLINVWIPPLWDQTFCSSLFAAPLSPLVLSGFKALLTFSRVSIQSVYNGVDNTCCEINPKHWAVLFSTPILLRSTLC